jgi:hypothetical protein
MVKRILNISVIIAFVFQIIYELILYFEISHKFYLTGFFFYFLDDKKPNAEIGSILFILFIAILSLIIGSPKQNLKYINVSILTFEISLLMWRLLIPLIFGGIKSI